MNKKSVLAQRTLLASIFFLLIAALCVVAFADYTELNISPVKQEKSNWCWVAAGQMAGSYINPSVHRSQSEICSHVTTFAPAIERDAALQTVLLTW